MSAKYMPHPDCQCTRCIYELWYRELLMKTIWPEDSRDDLSKWMDEHGDPDLIRYTQGG